MSASRGQFVWCELLTTDPAAAAEFYRRVIGWDAKDSGMTDRQYRILSAGDTPIGGLMELPGTARDNGARPGWLGYIGVDDVDAAAARIRQAGGVIHRAAEDIPGVGRFAVVADPQGASFVLFHGTEARAPSMEMDTAPGHVGWHELQAGEREGAFAFYADLFGWTKADAIDMGPMGIYQLFATGGAPVGGMMTRNEGMPVPFWLYYFNVDDIGAAMDRARQAGGKLLNGPQEVPGGAWVAHCSDPQGAMFAIVGPNKSPQ